MKVCILGCGNQGGCFAALLAMEGYTEHLILADMDESRAKRLKEQIQELGDRVKTRSIVTDRVDALNVDDIVRVAQGADLIFNAILPLCNLTIMQACLQVGAHYMDLYSLTEAAPGSPYEETIEAQLEMDAAFRAADLVALPCEGLSPGWTNLATKYIVDQMDTVESVIVRGTDWVDSKHLVALGPPKLQMKLSLNLGASSYLKNGAVCTLPEMDGGETFAFPLPVGEKTVYLRSVGAEEVISNRFAGKPLGSVMHKGALLGGPSDIKEIVWRAVREQVMRHPGTEAMNLLEVLASSMTPLADMDFSEALASGLVTNGAGANSVEVTGTKDGGRIHYTAYCVTTAEESVRRLHWIGPNSYCTAGGMPIILAEMLAKGTFKMRGVVTPAQIENPKSIFRKMKERGHLLTEQIERDM